MHAFIPILSALLVASVAAPLFPATQPAPRLVVDPDAVTDDIVVTGARISAPSAVTEIVRSQSIDLTTITRGMIREVKRDPTDDAEVDRRLAAENGRQR